MEDLLDGRLGGRVKNCGILVCSWFRYQKSSLWRVNNPEDVFSEAGAFLRRQPAKRFMYCVGTQRWLNTRITIISHKVNQCGKILARYQKASASVLGLVVANVSENHEFPHLLAKPPYLIFYPEPP